MPEIKDLLPSIESPTFDVFWGHYPRKTDKAKAKVAFERLPADEQFAAI